MKRRDFIKAFAISAASVPLATTLANTKGSEKVIETFQMSDMPDAMRPTGFNFTNGKDQTIVSMMKEGQFVDLGTSPSNNIQEITKQRHLVLAKNNQSFIHFVDNYLMKHNLPYSSFTYAYRPEFLMGYRRGTSVIGLHDYWRHPEYNGIAEQVYVREIEVLNPNQYFRML